MPQRSWNSTIAYASAGRDVAYIHSVSTTAVDQSIMTGGGDSSVTFQAAESPRDNTPAILCPVCHTSTPRTATECHDCGLIFLSRVPFALHSLPDYQVLRPLGSGGMSSVYLARKKRSSSLCVIKTLATVDTIDDPKWRAEAARCLREEYNLLWQLDHPNIPRVLYWVSTQQSEFMVLEYVPGLTLEQHLTRSNGHGGTLQGAALPVAEALSHGITVAGILDYLTRLPEPLVHHDIKPANLIVRSHDNRLMLVDFGSAVLVPDSVGEHVSLDCYGTPGYASPEQYSGQFSPKSDIYSLGATLYHLLTDDDPTTHPLAFPALGTLPPDVAKVLEYALADDPAVRPDPKAFLRKLQRLL